MTALLPAREAVPPEAVPEVAGSEPVGGGLALRIGFATLVVAFAGFGLWAATAPLDEAAVAPGEVKVDTYRKTVQHREGGIVRAILVRDGDKVAASQPLVLLEDVAVRARRGQLLSQYWDGLGTRARLVAERDGTGAVDFASALPPVQSPRIDEIRRVQANLFRARRTTLDGQIAVLRKRLVLYDREADALEAERRSKDRQLSLVEEEIGSVGGLVARGLERRPRLLALKREAEKLRGERDDYTARIARLRQAQAGTELEISNIDYKHLNEVAGELREVEAQIRDVEQQLAAVDDALARTVLRAPRAGVVVGLKVHTVGGVLQPGEAVMDIVPKDEALIVEARIAPEDIDRVHAGRPAQVRLRTFLRGLTPPAAGTVTGVSADLLHDERDGAPYYLARIGLDPVSLKGLPGPLTPGMQADVLVVTGERTALEYLLAPLTRAMAVGLTEK
ncbi:HlyD family type I secretion periplasmic adaptor subunit [Magnetospirillum sp. UT-4]|uniref:HlyD family type I secretion periplasmic adaptor subunit n=1 Tax=Magnetospirillum sp. UT-4 TaxID=2681467 RepID=UPI001380D805|nr:HlyD family type I secretion periplasmic adaptor subunit [Magnetospirillum sp. UT-4]CAA7619660.1 Type I secretion membrane fusion protein (HlyD family) [Magnetospirillum sp. UT-4]